MLKHNSHDIFYRNPVTPIKTGEKVRIRIEYDGSSTPILRTWTNKEQCYEMLLVDENLYEYTLTMPEEPCQLWYNFLIENNQGTIIYGNSNDMLGGEGQTYNKDFHSYLIVVYDKNFTTPDYLHKGIIYQIFPDRFKKGDYKPKELIEGRTYRDWHEDPLLNIDVKNGDNYAHDFFMGNLRGIVEKLDYLEDLGISVLYLNPIFKAGTNHRYDTGDYTKIDPYLGDDREFDLLCKEAEKRGIRIILDGVFSHSGADSKYFNLYNNYDSVGAYQSTESEYYNWYTFRNYPDDYLAWWGIYTLPELNKHDPGLQDFFLNEETGIASKWLKDGASGWRLDVADELPMDFLEKLRLSIKNTDEQAAIIGEVWEDASNKVAYEQIRCYCYGDTLDGVMNYPLRIEIINFLMGKTDAYNLSKLLLHQREVYPTPFLYACMNLISSHDRARILNVFADEEHNGGDRAFNKNVKLTKDQYNDAYKKYLKALSLLTALPGSPTVYYGDEAGMQGTADPWNRRPYPWGYIDRSLHEETREILQRRKNSSVLKTGDIDIDVIDENTIKIIREIKNGVDVFGNKAENGKVIMILDRSKDEPEWIFE